MVLSAKLEWPLIRSNADNTRNQMYKNTLYLCGLVKITYIYGHEGTFLCAWFTNRGYKHNPTEILLLTRIQDKNKWLANIPIYRQGIRSKTLMG